MAHVWWNVKCQRAKALRRRAYRQFQKCICTRHAELYTAAWKECAETIFFASPSCCQNRNRIRSPIINNVRPHSCYLLSVIPLRQQRRWCFVQKRGYWCIQPNTDHNAPEQTHHKPPPTRVRCSNERSGVTPRPPL